MTTPALGAAVDIALKAEDTAPSEAVRRIVLASTGAPTLRGTAGNPSTSWHIAVSPPGSDQSGQPFDQWKCRRKLLALLPRKRARDRAGQGLRQHRAFVR